MKGVLLIDIILRVRSGFVFACFVQLFIKNKINPLSVYMTYDPDYNSKSIIEIVLTDDYITLHLI